MSGTRRLMVLCAVILASACDDGGPGAPAPEPGPLNVVLATPRDDDGAVMFSISGGAVDSITALGYGIFTSQTAHDAHRVVVNGDIVDGPIARIWVPDRLGIGAYTLSIEQVAARGTYEQQQAAGYVLSLSAP
ncbi:MAG TPA: hypothetical protein VJ672_01000 [Gemmatimonadaceae bacterium]|nr:hypothetical protein [Gemmatimonadaceae bacterium]